MARPTKYDAAFYNRIRKDSRDSAGIIVPMVLDNMGKVSSVLDVGCGEGWFGAEFLRHGCDVVGLDDGMTVESSLEGRLVKWDLMESFGRLFPPVDLVVCLEVAEHLPESRARSFVADLCSAGKAVLFSAAIPGQGGTEHVNCQWPSYWADRFAESGYTLSMAPRWEIWHDTRVSPWYRNNLGIAIPSDLATHGRDQMIVGSWFGTAAAAPQAVIHPELWIDWPAAYMGPR